MKGCLRPHKGNGHYQLKSLGPLLRTKLAQKDWPIIQGSINSQYSIS